MALTRPPNVDDLKHLECFICREEEDRPSEQSQSVSHKWVHPCSCKLVAHESCLLTWISQSQVQNTETAEENALRCPQCKTRYVIDSDNPLVLRVFDSINRILSRWGKYVTLGTVVSVVISSGSGVYVLCSIYGEHALRQFLGTEGLRHLVGEDWTQWPWHAWINIPLVPAYLLLSRSKIFPSALSSWWCVFLAPHYTHLSPDEPIDLSHLASWPPHPMWYPILLPIIQRLYVPFREYVTRKVLGIDKPPEQRVRRYLWDLEAFQGRLEIDFRDEDEPIRDNGDARNQNARRAADDQDLHAEHPDAEDPQAANNEAVIRVTPYSLGRVIGSALILPSVSRWMGFLLYKMANGLKLYSLQHFLGLKTRRPLTLITVLDSFTDLDPVYWRNTVGLGLYLVAADCISLCHIWLKHREMSSRRIRNRSFAGVDMSGLDLLPSTSSS